MLLAPERGREGLLDGVDDRLANLRDVCLGERAIRRLEAKGVGEAAVAVGSKSAHSTEPGT